MLSQFALMGQARPHPFRAHVRRAAVRVRKQEDDHDVRLFALSFTAFFICFYTFIC